MFLLVRHNALIKGVYLSHTYQIEKYLACELSQFGIHEHIELLKALLISGQDKEHNSLKGSWRNIDGGSSNSVSIFEVTQSRPASTAVVGNHRVLPFIPLSPVVCVSPYSLPNTMQHSLPTGWSTSGGGVKPSGLRWRVSVKSQLLHTRT